MYENPWCFSDILEGGREFLEPHLKRISMSNKITRHFKIGTLHRIAIYWIASQKTNSLKTERPTTEGHRNDRNRVTHYSEGTTYSRRDSHQRRTVMQTPTSDQHWFYYTVHNIIFIILTFLRTYIDILNLIDSCNIEYRPCHVAGEFSVHAFTVRLTCPCYVLVG